VFRHPVWHDTGGGCHSSHTPSVALATGSIQGGHLFNYWAIMTEKNCPVVKWRTTKKSDCTITMMNENDTPLQINRLYEEFFDGLLTRFGALGSKWLILLRIKMDLVL
jgi:hypothetical protein